ncbi:MAG: putative protein serine/threonine kinase, partial [Streblomastix strix]
SSQIIPSVQQTPETNEYYEVIADYAGQAGNKRFLPISKDEKVKMIKKDAGWSTVEKDGQQGLVPTSYIRLMTETALGSSALLPNNIKKPFQLIQEKSDIQSGESLQQGQSIQQGQSAQSLSSIQTGTSTQSELPMQQGLPIQKATSQTNVISEQVSNTDESTIITSKYKYEDFEIIRALTSGAFGRVYVVKHKITSKLYILKRVPYLSNQEKKIANEEVNQLRLAQNKYTVILYDVFQFDVDICILQEFCSNGNMRDLIGLMKSWTVTRRKNKCTIYLYQMLSGLRAIHSKKILHRDIKPENILIDKYGNIKIADFGLALKLASQSYIHAAGTKNYSPSEAIISDRMTELSDIWAVGVVIIELITGINPFEGITQEETVMNIKVGRMKPLPDYIQGEMKDMLLGMVNVDAEKRPTVDQLLNSELMQLMDENEQMKEVENSQKINEIIKLQQESEQKVKEQEIQIQQLEKQKKDSEQKIIITEQEKHEYDKIKADFEHYKKQTEEKAQISEQKMREIEQNIKVAEQNARNAEERLIIAEQQNRDKEQEILIIEQQKKDAEIKAQKFEESLSIADLEVMNADEQIRQIEKEKQISEEKLKKTSEQLKIIEREKIEADSRTFVANEKLKQAEDIIHIFEQRKENAFDNASLSEQLRIQAEQRAVAAESRCRDSEEKIRISEQKQREAEEQVLILGLWIAKIEEKVKIQEESKKNSEERVKKLEAMLKNSEQRLKQYQIPCVVLQKIEEDLQIQFQGTPEWIRQVIDLQDNDMKLIIRTFRDKKDNEGLKRVIESGIVEALLQIFWGRDFKTITRNFSYTFTQFTNTSVELQLIIFKKNPFPGLLRLLDHPDLWIVGNAVQSINNIIIGGGTTTAAAQFHPYYENMQKFGGIEKMVFLFRRKLDKWTQNNAAICIGLIYRSKEIRDVTLRKEIIHHLKNLINDSDVWLKLVSKDALKGLAMNALNKAEMETGGFIVPK